LPPPPFRVFLEFPFVWVKVNSVLELILGIHISQGLRILVLVVAQEDVRGFKGIGVLVVILAWDDILVIEWLFKRSIPLVVDPDLGTHSPTGPASSSSLEYDPHSLVVVAR
jgi:hypothetical protein